MKTGLVTFYHIHHYGALLQAAATERAVESLGSDCEIVDYYVNQDNSLFKKPTGLGSAAHDAHTALHYQPLKARYDRFEKFTRDHIRISPHRYLSFEELQKAELPYDVILSGSDQIWNPKIFPDGHFDPVFFGTFSPKRKIAYAPSFGIPAVPEGMEGELKGYLDQFSHVSTRERQGQKIVRDAAEREVPVVLDPTLLLNAEQWRAMSNPAYPEPKLCTPGQYILCYCINNPGALAPYIEQLSRQTGLPIVQLCGIRKKVHPKAKCVLDAGPAEFLSLFANAAFVITNSFHGTVFSTQFQKPFFTAVAPSEMAAPERSRTFSILTTLGLTERVIGKGDTAGLRDPIDWDAVTERLNAARASSMAYLKAALANETFLPLEPEKQPEGGLPVLADHNHCTGCTACESSCPKTAISMRRDQEGFAYPVVNLSKCVHCGRCLACIC